MREMAVLAFDISSADMSSKSIFCKSSFDEAVMVASTSISGSFSSSGSLPSLFAGFMASMTLRFGGFSGGSSSSPGTWGISSPSMRSSRCGSRQKI